MATETFDKSFFITDPKAIKKIIDIIESEPVNNNLYTTAQRLSALHGCQSSG